MWCLLDTIMKIVNSPTFTILNILLANWNAVFQDYFFSLPLRFTHQFHTTVWESVSILVVSLGTAQSHLASWQHIVPQEEHGISTWCPTVTQGLLHSHYKCTQTDLTFYCTVHLVWCTRLPVLHMCCLTYQISYTFCLTYSIIVLHTSCTWHIEMLFSIHHPPCLAYWTVVLYLPCLMYQFSIHLAWHIGLLFSTHCLTSDILDCCFSNILPEILDCCSPHTLPDILDCCPLQILPDISVLHASIGLTYQPDISSPHTLPYTGLLFSKHLARHIISPHMYWTDVSVFHTPCLTYWTVVLYMPWIPDFSTHLLPDVLDCWFPPIHQYLAYHVAASTLKTDGFNHYVLQTVFLISAPLGTKGYPPTWRQSMEYLCCLNLECHSKQQPACMETPYHASHQPMLQAAPSVWGLCQGELTVQQDVHSIGPNQWQCTSLDILDFPTSVLPLAELCCWVQSSNLENQPTKKQNVWEILWRSIWTNLQKRDSTPYPTDFTEPHSQRYNVVQLQTMKVLSTWDRRRELSYSRAAKISMLGIKYSVASSVQVCPKITVRNIHFLTTGIHL